MVEKFFGYGVDLTKLKFNNVGEFVKKYTNNIYEDAISDLDDVDKDILGWLDNYQNDGGYYGLSAYLAEVINQEEDLELSCYDSVAYGYIYVQSTYPWALTDKMKSLTKESLEAIIIKYLSQITETEIRCEYLTMWRSTIDD